jgi:hypothetical protein
VTVRVLVIDVVHPMTDVYCFRNMPPLSSHSAPAERLKWHSSMLSKCIVMKIRGSLKLSRKF